MSAAEPAEPMSSAPTDIYSQADILVPQSQQTKLVRIEGEVGRIELG